MRDAGNVILNKRDPGSSGSKMYNENLVVTRKEIYGSYVFRDKIYSVLLYSKPLLKTFYRPAKGDHHARRVLIIKKQIYKNMPIRYTPKELLTNKNIHALFGN